MHCQSEGGSAHRALRPRAHRLRAPSRDASNAAPPTWTRPSTRRHAPLGNREGSRNKVLIWRQDGPARGLLPTTPVPFSSVAPRGWLYYTYCANTALTVSAWFSLLGTIYCLLIPVDLLYSYMGRTWAATKRPTVVVTQGKRVTRPEGSSRRLLPTPLRILKTEHNNNDVSN